MTNFEYRLPSKSTFPSNVLQTNAEYINREKDFARQEFLRKHGQCVYKANKLPKWAKGNPSEFFKSADVYGRKNKASYREFELALQEELTLEQNIEIVLDGESLEDDFAPVHSSGGGQDAQLCNLGTVVHVGHHVAEGNGRA